MKKFTVFAIIFSMLAVNAFFAACRNPAGPGDPHTPGVVGPTPTVITSVTLTIVEPAFGQTPATTATSATPSGNYTVDTVSWHPNHNTFEADNTYTVTITVQANANFAFNNSTTATINGEAVTPFTLSVCNTEVTLTRTFPATGNTPITPITSIDITGLVAPVTGAAPNTSFTYNSGAGFTAGTLTWAPNHDPFQGGVEYTASITFTRDNTDYQFTDATTVTYNAGTLQSVTHTGSALTVTLTFPKTDTPITSVVISGIIPPVAGESPVFTANAAGTGFNAGAVAVTWAPSSDPFSAVSYTASVTLNANPGYVFANPLTTATINGQPATVTFQNADETVTLEFAFTTAVAGAPPVITPALLPNGRVGIWYSQELMAAGVGPITWSSSGTLPDNLSFDPATRIISGTPTVDGTFTFDISAANIYGTTTETFTITIVPPTAIPGPINITGLTAPATGVPPSTAANASGTGITAGAVTVSWDGSGNFVANTTRTASVTLTANPGYTFAGGFNNATINSAGAQVSVTGSGSGNSVTVSRAFNIPRIDTATLPGGTSGQSYNQTLQATAPGSPSITWSLASGSPPAGLSLSAAGVISGTPSAAGTSNFTVRAANTCGSFDTRELSITIGPPLFTVPALAAFTTAVESLTNVIHGINTGVTNVVSITINGSNAHFGTQQVAGFITNVTVTLNFTGPNIDNAVRTAVGDLIRAAGFTFADANVTVNSTPRFVLPMSQSEFILAINSFVLNDRVGTVGTGSFAINSLTINSYAWNDIDITIEFTAPVGTNLVNSVATQRIRDHIIDNLMETHKAAINPLASVNANHVAVTVVSDGPNVNELTPSVPFPPPVPPGIIASPFVSPTMADIEAFMDLWRGNNTGSTAGGSIRDQVNRLVPVSVNSGTNKLANFGMMALPQHIADISIAMDGTNRRLFALRVPLAQPPVGENWPAGRALTQHPPNVAGTTLSATPALNNNTAPGLVWRPVAGSSGFTANATRVSPFPMFGPNETSRESLNLVTNDGGNPLSYRIYIFEVGMTNFTIPANPGATGMGSAGWNNVVRARYGVPSTHTDAQFRDFMVAHYGGTWANIRDNIIGVAGGNTQTIVSMTYTDYDIHGNVVFRFNTTTVNTAVPPHDFAPGLPRPGGSGNEDATPGGAVTNQLFNALTLYFWPRQ